MISDVTFLKKKFLKKGTDWIQDFDGIDSNEFHYSIDSETDLKSSKR